MSVKFGDSNIGAEIGTPSLNASISKPSINVTFNAPSLGASGGSTIRREIVNPQFFIGNVETLDAGEDVYCYLTGTRDEPVLNFGIPMGFPGADGVDGQDGQDGFSPTAAVSKVGDTAIITITDKNGTTTASISDGQDGINGQDGQDGADGVSPEVTIVTIIGGHSVTITDADHPTGQTFNVMDGISSSTAFTVTLASASWSNNEQTVSDVRFLASGYAFVVSPASGSFTDYAESQIYADDVSTDGQMTFHCADAPSSNLTVNIVRMVA